jgi:hypothetical protein
MESITSPKNPAPLDAVTQVQITSAGDLQQSEELLPTLHQTEQVENVSIVPQGDYEQDHGTLAMTHNSEVQPTDGDSWFEVISINGSARAGPFSPDIAVRSSQDSYALFAFSLDRFVAQPANESRTYEGSLPHDNLNFSTANMQVQGDGRSEFTLDFSTRPAYTAVTPLNQAQLQRIQTSERVRAQNARKQAQDVQQPSLQYQPDYLTSQEQLSCELQLGSALEAETQPNVES